MKTAINLLMMIVFAAMTLVWSTIGVTAYHDGRWISVGCAMLLTVISINIVVRKFKLLIGESNG